jgi:hypothetical protein
MSTHLCVHPTTEGIEELESDSSSENDGSVEDEAGSLEAELWEIHQLEKHLLDGEFADDFEDE